jgi:hypothetical protein
MAIEHKLLKVTLLHFRIGNYMGLSFRMEKKEGKRLKTFNQVCGKYGISMYHGISMSGHCNRPFKNLLYSSILY